MDAHPPHLPPPRSLTVTDGGASIADSAIATDTLSIYNSNANFNGSVVTIRSLAGSSGLHSHLTLTSDSTDVFSVLASGRTQVHSGGVHIQGGGLLVDNTGQTIASGGAR